MYKNKINITLYITGVCSCQFGRAVKANDLKSFGISRAGSNPAVDVFINYKLFF